MRLSYANVVSTVALVLALGGTGAYAAEKLDGKDLKNESVTGKKVKNGTVTAQDLAGGVVTTGPAGPQGPAGPAGARGAADVTMIDVDRTAVVDLTPVVVQQVAGLTIYARCTVPGPDSSFSSAILSASSVLPAQVGVTTQKYAGTPETTDSATTSAVAAGAKAFVGGTSTIQGRSSMNSFVWKDADGVRTGHFRAYYETSDNSCHFDGWILHG